MLVTNSSRIAELATSLRNHGSINRKSKTTFLRSGYNYKMTDIQATLGLGQLSRIHERITEAREQARRYSRLLRSARFLRCPTQERGVTHSYQSYCVLVEGGGRDRAIRSLAAKGVQTNLGYYALHLQDAFRKYRNVGALEVSSRAFTKSLVLPIYPGLREKDQRYVAKELIAATEASD